MKLQLVILFSCFFFLVKSQLIRTNTGTLENLVDISVYDKNILIGGIKDYLVKSSDNCNTLFTVTLPSPTGYALKFNRPDSNTIFLLAYTPNHTLLYKSTNGGNNWIKRLDTVGSFHYSIGFFNTNEGIMSGLNNYDLLRTTNGGITWVSNPSPLFNIEALKTFGDSLVCIGGIGVPNALGVLYLSKDRGNTWPYVWGVGGLGKTPTDFCFLNKDTIVVISENGMLAKTTNGGLSWNNSIAPIKNAYGVNFKSVNEGYVIGANNNSEGIVIKTDDFGKTWATFNTGISTTLLNIVFMNDSIALLTGTKGILLKYNYKTSIFTNLEEETTNNLDLILYPNPVKDFLYLNFNKVSSKPHSEVTIINTLGQIVYSKKVDKSVTEINLNFLHSGIYFVNFGINKETKTYKIMKE